MHNLAGANFMIGREIRGASPDKALSFDISALSHEAVAATALLDPATTTEQPVSCCGTDGQEPCGGGPDSRDPADLSHPT